MSDCIFCKIANKEITTHLLYEDDQIIAFNDIDPKAPQHKLIIPKQHISTLNEVDSKHEKLLGHMIVTAQKLAEELQIAENGYRLIINCNRDGGQAVYHIHLHLIGGRTMHWPPG